MRANIQRRQNAEYEPSAILTIVPAESAPRKVPQAALNIIPAEDAPPAPAAKPVPPESVSSALMQIWAALEVLVRSVIRLLGQVRVRRVNKRLQLRETVSLGDKRFVAIVEVDGQQFLLGGSQSSVSMLAQLGAEASFSQALKRQCESDRNFV
jgi:flagellar biogenesis protein FliO